MSGKPPIAGWVNKLGMKSAFFHRRGRNAEAGRWNEAKLSPVRRSENFIEGPIYVP
jgi:hypothetical protein